MMLWCERMWRRKVRLIQIAACGLLVALCGCNLQARTYIVSSDSMAPLIQTGDRVYVDQSEGARTQLHDGDVIAMKHGDVVVLKRILAMPGETIRGEDRKVFRNGKLLVEPYVAASSGQEEVPSELITFPKRTVAAGELFVAGDNRDHSFDSRMESYGAVKVGDVVGQYRWTFWRAPTHER